MDKREFIKTGLLGLGGLFCGFNPNKLLSERKIAKDFKPDKWSKEASYYVQTARGLKCKLCPNECIIENEDDAKCRTHINYNNKLYSIAYGNPCAVHVDPVEKKPLYHFFPQSKAYSIATAGCNMVCLNCQNWTISQKNPRETRNYDLPPEKVVEQAIKHKCKSIAYTYSEPIVFYEYVYDTAKIARLKGIKNIFISAGFINEQPLRKIAKYLDAANIDLKSFSDEIYEQLNGGSLKPVLNTLKVLKEENVWLEITNLLVPDWTDDLDMIKKMCDWLYNNDLHMYPLHFSRFHPTYKLTKLPSTPVDKLNKAYDIAKKAGIQHVYIGNVVGSKAQNTVCPNCKKTVIERIGFTITLNKIKNDKCSYCNHEISGIWE